MTGTIQERDYQRDEEIFRRYSDSENGSTQKELAEEYGVTRQRISQILKRHPKYFGPRYHRQARVADGGGKYRVYYPEHPYADGTGHIYEHVAAAEDAVGRMIDLREEVVLALDYDYGNLKPENLRVVPRFSAEHKEHTVYKYRTPFILLSLRWCAMQLQRTPTTQELLAMTFFTPHLIVTRFGSMTKAAELVGLDPVPPGGKGRLGRRPISEAFRSVNAVLLQYKTWGNVTAAHLRGEVE